MEIHLITNQTKACYETILNIHKEVSYIHLRERQLSPREVCDLITYLLKNGIPKNKLIINDRADIAYVYGLYGVQLTYNSISLSMVKRSFPTLVIGKSVHSVKEAISASEQGANFVFFGHIWPTSSHPNEMPQGLQKLSQVVSSINTPVIAIGGIKPNCVPLVKQTGAKGVAVISGILNANNPLQAVMSYKNMLNV